LKIELFSDLAGERIIELPERSTDFIRHDWQDHAGITCLPGRYFGLQSPARESQSGLLLPSNGRWLHEGATAERHRPDVVTMVSVGTGDIANYVLPGGVYAVRPYGGFKNDQLGIDGAWFGGLPKTRSWKEEIILEWTGETWVPVGGWVAIRPDAPCTGLELTDHGWTQFVKTGTVERTGKDSTHLVGKRVALAKNWYQSIPEDQEFFCAGWDDEMSQYIFCRQTTWTGKHVNFAVIE